MTMPNKFHKAVIGIFVSFYRGYYTFFWRIIITLWIFGKTANPLNAYYIRRNIRMICLKFVWRQLGFAFFGALTSVGALFYFTGKY